jgi:hypothetical protein
MGLLLFTEHNVSLILYFVWMCIINGCTAFFFVPWQLFQFLNPIYSRQDSLDGGSDGHEAYVYTQDNTRRINMYMHQFL